MIYYRNTSINTKIAPIVKWYNMSMVRISFKFDSWWGHQENFKSFNAAEKNISIF